MCSGPVRQNGHVPLLCHQTRTVETMYADDQLLTDGIASTQLHIRDYIRAWPSLGVEGRLMALAVAPLLCQKGKTASAP